MKRIVATSYILGALTLLGLSAVAQATPSITPLSDTGTWRVATYNASNGVTGLGTSPLINPFGVPPVPQVETITPGNTWSATFTPTADFMTYASNSGGPVGKSVLMGGKVDFYIVLDAPAKLFAEAFLDGIYAVSGNGTVGVAGGINVTGLDEMLVPREVHGSSFPAETRNGIGGWSVTGGVDGFTVPYQNYKVSIDSTLLAESLSAESGGSAYFAQKDFTLVFSNIPIGGVPEPASLGFVAIGGLALLARRRRC